MKTIKVVLLNILFALIGISQFNCGDNGVGTGGKTITVSGVVTDELNNPVEAAYVSIYQIGEGLFGTTRNFNFTTHTNSLGKYSIANYYNHGPVELVAGKTIKDSQGTSLTYKGSGTSQLQWTDEIQVIDIIIKK